MLKSIYFNRCYFVLATVLFLTEVFIALYVRDDFIRPFFGDYLVVILIYACVRTFFKIQVWLTCLGVLIFSYLIEALQYYNLVGLLGLQDSVVANVIIGNSFSWVDIWWYTLGILTVFALEKLLRSAASGRKFCTNRMESDEA